MQYFDWPWWLVVVPTVLLSVGFFTGGHGRGWIWLLPILPILFYGLNIERPAWLQLLFWLILVGLLVTAVVVRAGYQVMVLALTAAIALALAGPLLGIIPVSSTTAMINKAEADMQATDETAAMLVGDVEELESRMDKSERSAAQQKVRSDRSIERLVVLERQMREANKRLDAHDERLDDHEQRIGALEKEVAKHSKAIADLQANSLTASDLKDYVVSHSSEDVTSVVGALVENQVTVTPTGSCLPDREKAAKALGKTLARHDFGPDEINVGTVDWSKSVEQRGNAPFSYETAKTRQQLAGFLQGSSPASQAARNFLKSQVPESEWNCVLSGEAHIPVQFLVDTEFSGNGYFNGKEFQRGGHTSYKAGDVVWVYVSPETYKVNWEASVRADCLNPGYSSPPKPVRPAEQPAKPRESPSQPVTTTPDKPKTDKPKTDKPKTDKPDPTTEDPTEEETEEPTEEPTTEEPSEEPTTEEPSEEPTTEDPTKTAPHPCKVDPTDPMCSQPTDEPAPSPTGEPAPSAPPSAEPPPVYTPPTPSAPPTTPRPTPVPTPVPSPVEPVNPTETAPPGDPCDDNPSLPVCD